MDTKITFEIDKIAAIYQDLNIQNELIELKLKFNAIEEEQKQVNAMLTVFISLENPPYES